MAEITCLRCKKPVDAALDACPHCEEKITNFQRTYATRLIDGKYEILERLGMGGMGEIFKVRHIHLGEERVIKIMRANIASDEQALQRFLYEARTSTMIKHRNLAMLYDFSTLEDGSYYMVWEFIDGTNIQKWMAANGPMPARLALEIAIQTLDGLDHLHQMGLIHRDISPENIMLSQDHQGKLLAKVIDFGIAKQLSEAGPGHGLTQTGMFLGKLKYASPEQAGFLKEGEHLDARSDLYSFGVVFYEMLAGRAPFVATNPQGYILKHATERPPAISQVNPNVSIPPRLEEQVFIALAKEREERHHSAADFAAELEELRSEVPPDEKFGLGDSKTFSGRTIPDRPRGARTAGSRYGQSTGQQPTLADEADVATTVNPALATGQQPTLADRREDRTPTVVDRRPEETPTVLDIATGRTLTLPQPGAPAKKRTAVYAAIAATILLLIASGAYFITQREPDVPPVTDTGTATTIDVRPSPTPAPTPQIVASGQEGFVLVARPYGQLERIVDARTKQQVPYDVSGGRGETPVVVNVPPGEYELIVSGLGTAAGQQKTISVTVRQGEMARSNVRFPMDLDRLSNEILTTR
jgi:serine/threonine-protein kinase